MKFKSGDTVRHNISGKLGTVIEANSLYGWYRVRWLGGVTRVYNDNNQGSPNAFVLLSDGLYADSN